jgi:hypothetical protein
MKRGIPNQSIDGSVGVKDMTDKKPYRQFFIVAGVATVGATILFATSVADVVALATENKCVGRFILGLTLFFIAVSMFGRGLFVRYVLRTTFHFSKLIEQARLGKDEAQQSPQSSDLAWKEDRIEH